jgi:hypothetical protein
MLSHLGGTCNFFRDSITAFLDVDGIVLEAVLSHVSTCRQINHDLDPTILFFSLTLDSRAYLERKKIYYSVHSSLLKGQQCFFVILI